jgi:multicomponent Na+:H+ antiporter subunit E
MVTEPTDAPEAAATDADGRRRRFTALALLAGALTWLALAGLDPGAAVIGAPTVAAAAAAASCARGWRHAPRALAAARFAPGFLLEIFVSAVDMARLLLSRDPRLAPAIVDYPLRLKTEGARAAFMNAVTLTPGTLSAALWEDRLAVHALAPDDTLAPTLATLEARIAPLYGETLEDPAA